MTFFDSNLLRSGEYHDWLVQGFTTSLQLLGASFAIALPLGVAIALMRTSHNRLLRGIGTTLVEGIRNVPLLAHLLFWYFAFPELLPEPVKLALYDSNPEFICATIALSLYAGVHMAEDIRSGIRAIPAQQFEAGRALGFSFLATMRLCIVPQALRLAAPPLLSQTLNLWQNTSIATVIGVAELMYQTQRVEAASFRSVEAFVFASAAYLAVSLLIAGLAALLQRKVS